MNRSGFLLALCFAWASATDVDIRRPIPASSSPRGVCSHAGIICSATCDEVILCVDNGDDTYTPITVQNCDSDLSEVCSQKYSNCSSTDLSCKLAQKPFHCTGPGYFPDPYDCTIYHVCLVDGGTANTEKCDPGYAYDPLTTACSLQLTSRPCVDGPLPPCSYAGQTGVDPENPSIYYVCVKDDITDILVYTLRKCEFGWIYNPSTYHCVESETTGTPTSSPTSGTTTTMKPPYTGDHCQYLGVYPDEENCHYYYLCTEDLQWKHCACFIGFYFNRQQSQCALGVC